MMRWFALQDPDDDAPYAVGAFDDQEGLPRRFVPGKGLVHWPSLAMYMVNGEPGAHPIPEAEAMKMIDAGVGQIDDGFVTTEQGRGQTLPVPTRDETGDGPADPATGAGAAAVARALKQADAAPADPSKETS